MRLTEIQQQIGTGEYRVDPHAVAEAIIRRLLGAPRLAGPRGPGEPAAG